MNPKPQPQLQTSDSMSLPDVVAPPSVVSTEGPDAEGSGLEQVRSSGPGGQTSGPEDRSMGPENRPTAPEGTAASRGTMRWRNRLLAVLLGLAVGLVIAETLVRVLGLEPQQLRSKLQLINRLENPPVYYHCYPSNPHGELRALPDVTKGEWQLQDYTFEHSSLPLERLAETPWCVEYRHSSQGIRDREFSPEPAEGVTRVAIVGDSFVFGEGVPVERTLPRQVGELLGKSFECINGGQVGANAAQEVTVLKQIVGGTGSRRAILVFIPNDITLTPRLARQQDYINDLILIRDRYLQLDRKRAWYTGHLRVLDLAMSPLALRKIRSNTIEWYRSCYDPAQNGVHLEELKRHFKSIQQLSGCRSVLVIYPLLEGFDTQYPFTDIHRRVAALAEEVGLPVLDLAPAFAGRIPRSLWVDEADHHPNGVANQIAAAAIVKWLEQDVSGYLSPQTTKHDRQSTP